MIWKNWSVFLDLLVLSRIRPVEYIGDLFVFEIFGKYWYKNAHQNHKTKKYIFWGGYTTTTQKTKPELDHILGKNNPFGYSKTF